jgi:hypothetical protein
MIGKYIMSLEECSAAPVSGRAMTTVLLVEVGLPLGVWLGLVVHWPGVVVRQQEPTRNPSLRFRMVVRLSFAQLKVSIWSGLGFSE